MEQTFLSNLALMGIIGILGTISPGPDFAIVTKNSLIFSRRTGLYTALGVSLGVLIHMAYCLAGIGLIIKESALLFNCIKYSGAAYLIYIGLKSLLTKPVSTLELGSVQKKQDLTTFKALQIGFITNALNPKATLFFLSVFTQMIDSQTSFIQQIAFVIEMWLIVFAWFSLLAFILSHPNLRARILRLQGAIEKSLGAILIGFGLKVAFL